MGQREWRVQALREVRGETNVNALLALSRAIDTMNSRLGRWLSWLILITVPA